MRWMTTILLAVILLFLLSFRVDIGLHRFFDADEFTHVSLAMQVLHGQKPYLDFMTFFTPLYSWFLSIPFRFLASSVDVFIMGRIVSLGVFFTLLGVLTVLYGVMRGWKYALLPAIILTFLPLPYDKFTEIRPDTLSALLGFSGILFLVLAMKQEKHMRYWFFSGVLFSFSVLVLQKSLPFLAVGVVFCVVSLIHEYRVHFFRTKEFLRFIGGIVLPFVLFFTWVVFVIKDADLVRYSLTTLAFEVNLMSRYYFMEPHLYFFPLAQFYGSASLTTSGSSGITAGLLFNHAIWFLGIIAGAQRLLTPWLSPDTSKNRVYREGMLSALFFLLVYLYMYYVPLKHLQYLIPIAVCIAYYASDAAALLLHIVEKRIRPIGALVVIAVLGVGLVTVTRETEAIKMTQTNTEQMNELVSLEKVILPDDTVVDLEGRLFRRTYAYPLCCLPFGAFEQFISRRPPALRTVLEEKKVPYVYQGETNRISVLSGEDQEYLSNNYEVVDGFNGGLLKRKD
ncbi:hypothetical protein HY947_01770 [Candidatus Gottesmanbacteria bacterium]|nr:hypothetical protein [Candidatus Gottesmanbacteria bacterium]